MINKFIKTYALLLVLSILANYLLVFFFPSILGSQATFLHTLFCAVIILLAPFIISLAIAGIYKLVKHSNYVYYWQSVWVSWAVIYIIPFVGLYVLQSQTL
jgi:hypothetical protein